MINIPGVEMLLSFFVKTKCSPWSFRQLVEVIDDLPHAFLGYLVWFTVDEFADSTLTRTPIPRASGQ